MKPKLLLVLPALLAAGLCPLVAADSNSPQPAAKEAPASAPTPIPSAPTPADTSDVKAALNHLVERVRAKLQNGPQAQEAFEAELKEFDALVARHRNEKSEEVAQVLVMKALLYAQVFDDLDKTEATFKQLQSEFPETESGKRVAEVLPKIQQQKERMKLQSSLKPGAVFPDFAAKTMSGEDISASKFKGKVVLVDFWATWCPPCVAELPNVLAAYRRYHNRGFEIIGISLDEDKDALESFLKKNEMSWPQIYEGKGWQSSLVEKYGVTSIPTTLLLDKDGKIVERDLRGPALDDALAKLLP